jgi:CrcB protein
MTGGMERFLWVCLGGAVGTGLRYLVSEGAQRAFGNAWPWGTLAVNLAGCLLMGALMHTALSTASIGPTLRFALGTGFLGGLTTYSAFDWEATAMVRSGAHARAALYLGVTVVGCFLAGLIGVWAARRVLGA